MVGRRGRRDGGEGEKGEIMLESDPGTVRIFLNCKHASGQVNREGATTTPRAAPYVPSHRVLCSDTALLEFAPYYCLYK